MECRECRWYDKIRNAYEPECSGFCRRKAPIGGGTAKWPEVLWSDYCGEFEAIKEKKETRND